MSRIIVKGLPVYAAEDRIREHFGKQGEVTDVKLMKKRNGESRKFAFVGYKTFEDAEKAVRYFNRAFMDTARLDVQLAKSFADPDVPLSWKDKKRAADERANRDEERLQLLEAQKNSKRQRINPIAAVDSKIAQDFKLQEFMEAVKPSAQQQTYAANVAASNAANPSSVELEKVLEAKAAPVITAREEESDDEYETFNKKEDDETEQVDIDEPMVSLSAFSAPEENEDAAEIESTEGMTDLDWLKSRRTRMKEQNDETHEEKELKEKTEVKSDVVAQEIEPVQKEHIETESEKTERIIYETGRLFLRNISYSSSEDDFRDLFSPYGALEEVHIAIDTRTNTNKGFAYIKFENPRAALKAFHELDKQIFQGRLLHILPGKAKKDHRLDEFDLKNLPLKKQRELKKKADASKAQFSWNSLYMSQDAILDSVAQKMGIAKSDIIDAQDSNSAVKQALAEAHVIGDVRKYFETKGVDLTSFDRKEKDDKIILVKNFPFGTTIQEITEMFAEHGQLKRTLMPPAGTIAIVEYLDAPSGRSAFSKLAFRRFKKSILYLEKGPKNLFTSEATADDVVELLKEDEKAPATLSSTDILETAEKDDDQIDGPTVSVFVKGLNFATTQADLADFFKALPGFVVAVIKTKPDPKDSKKVQSMGFGFVEFRTKQQAEAAISTKSGTSLDGYNLQLKLSHRQAGQASSVEKSKKSAKIIVKNLPFEATRKDVFELFSAFGQLKSVRVPKKFDKSARGFAFVEFVLSKEAESAMDQLQGVHLLGRRLVMQYAELESVDVESEIEKMTKKAKKQAATRQLAALQSSSKQKMDLEEDDGKFSLDRE
ncbi:unnamed protein product [Kuraishia capsulata CBS 1993]|uniref:Multiple RNA-binding domain-containing protein 1 n=1 Tax=Kuraishia capsulata CBS 1993 TaxID=1382522 RepID=W6MPA1_9ASCO|nr:uncharacterized protein KUCA_T00004477001 [Kuraishia capsulata CBS 1993]CDK28494.1 unnamed protein product [Kuraishia capsulata CBS 1993]